MADACLRILSDTQLTQQLIAAGQELVREFAWNQVRDRLFDVYHNASNGSTPLPAVEIR